MAFISVTRLRIRSIRFLPAFALHTFGTLRQVRAAPGFKGGKLLTDLGWSFWTMTAWDAQDSMRAYMSSGAHRAAMPRLATWCDEASVAHWNQPEAALPSWVEADQRMRDSGRPSKLRHASPDHAGLTFKAPRMSGSAPITPSRRAADRNPPSVTLSSS